MRTLLTLLLLAGSALAQAAPKEYVPYLNPNVPEDAGGKKARAVLNQAIHALGGDAFLTYRDMTQKGRTYRFYRERPVGGGAPYWLFWRWPDRERVELTKQRDIIYIYNGDNGYETTFKGTRPEEPAALAAYLRAREYSITNVMRRWLKDPGTSIFYVGTAVVDQKPVDKISIMNAHNQAVTLSIDQIDHLIVEKRFTTRDPKTREKDEDWEIYSSYRKVQGINTPHATVAFHNGEQVRQRFIEQISYNVGVDEALFNPVVTYDPAAKKK